MGGLGQRIRSLAWLSVLELYRRKDLYVALVLTAVVLVPLSAYNVFGVTGVVRHLREVSLLLVWLFSILVGISVAGRQFPPELENRTIYPLLAKPVRRWELLLGKFLGALLASGSALLLFYLGFVVVAGLKQGIWLDAVTVQAFLLHLAFLLVVTALALLGSLLLTPAANVTLCGLVTAGMLLFGGQLAGLAREAAFPANCLAWLLNLAGPHLDFFDLRQRVVHGWEPLPLGVLAAVLLYALCYTGLLLGGAAWLLHRKKI
ncbi:MAG: ABC transporter permease subunit [Lentisphaeria bacterium]|jgi:ABC-type transport system involved in multi-copper enzyme maturation permease subunit